MDISIPIFIVLIVAGVISLLIGFNIKGKGKVFGQKLETSKQTWARFWITCGWVIIVLSAVYFIFAIVLRLYMHLY
ncbi:hypothetical protein [Lactobacillus hominis]|uniref:Uncharacterized protein n=1 Tax=Lactobacillus hominis DSM 23910 = CRBIP 24.179 TaxID=1423758 RepID=I7L960_9LACO|nr:hypothetical protein [Lactobacillus hominis]KRM85419.1 hypothetical protein FC41_GL001401 [Lactobacillus hominis DSM 23910 = CRBIP 24.179]MCT3347503.1 hypothetical protein [Lactobacillus hominis]CCI81164.1 Putative uncharacterized protein [Lactobacillus hominis DSM 23910 = CRBIP 24.179]